jgi:4-hydroxybenzoate polyprenyltransferase
MVSVADVAFGQAAPTKPSFRNKIIGLITLQRVALIMIGLPLVAGAMALAGGRFDDPRLPILLLVTWLINAAGNVTHDIVDTERDKEKWPL